jgi:superfamily I DNA/RNA helicase
MLTKIHGSPGCGKTTYLKGVYQKLLETGYKSEDITVLTFRKNAADDLISAIKPYTKLDEKEVKKHVGTIHSICLRLCGNPGVIDEDDLQAFTEMFGYNFVARGKSAEESSRSGNLFDLYSWLRNTCTPFDQWRKYPGSDKIKIPADQVTEFLKNYEFFKNMMKRIDYSDMLQQVIDQKISLDTPILMVDEFQDLTVQMNQVFEMWVETCKNVYIAGDPNQSIYGFFGGSPDYFKNWEAEEIILDETYRLPEPIHNYSRDLLKCHQMSAPDIKSVKVDSNVIFRVPYHIELPTFPSELHLIRCNYQAGALAMKLATEGKVFSASRYGWKDKEIEAANGIITLRTLNDAERTPQQMNALRDLYQNFDFDTIRSGHIFDGLISNNKLLRAKLAGIMNRTCIIKKEEVQNRKILTIHGAKGLEADAVFLHLGITPEIRKAILLPGEEARAEARVWYVGITRAKKVLYLIEDAKYNYSLMDVKNYNQVVV